MMKQRALIILMLLLPVCLASQQTPEEKYGAGANSYAAGEYDKALEMWHDIYKTGYRSAELNYNIGNAHFKLNNIPAAILFYERAYLLHPGDEDINYNLQIAKIFVVDRFEEIPELFFVRWFNLIALSLSTNTWARTSIVTFILFLICLSLYFYTSKYRLKVMGFWLAILFLLASLSSLALTLRNKNLVYDSGKAVIFSPVVNGKSSPDNSGTDLFVLHEGTKVTIEDEVGDWYEIRLSDGNKGWVSGNSLEII
ncbi:MAG: SH3 domain-containing protein [Bacteroidota bacterium]